VYILYIHIYIYRERERERPYLVHFRHGNLHQNKKAAHQSPQLRTSRVRRPYNQSLAATHATNRTFAHTARAATHAAARTNTLTVANTAAITAATTTPTTTSIAAARAAFAAAFAAAVLETTHPSLQDRVLTGQRIELAQELSAVGSEGGTPLQT